MEETRQAVALDYCSARIIRDGNRFVLEPYTSDSATVLERMAEDGTPVVVTPTNFVRAKQ